MQSQNQSSSNMNRSNQLVEPTEPGRCIFTKYWWNPRKVDVLYRKNIAEPTPGTVYIYYYIRRPGMEPTLFGALEF